MGSNGGGSCTGYSVEAKHFRPIEFGGQMFHTEWMPVSFTEASTGIPARPEGNHGLMLTRLYSYEGAQALRWWLKAAFPSHLLETRLVPHAVNYNFSAEPQEPIDAILEPKGISP